MKGKGKKGNKVVEGASHPTADTAATMTATTATTPTTDSPENQLAPIAAASPARKADDSSSRPLLPRVQSVEPRNIGSKNWDALDVFELVKTRELLHERFNQHQLELSRQIPRTFVWRTSLKLLDRTDEELQALDETLARKINDILTTGRQSEKAIMQQLDELQKSLVATAVGTTEWFACFTEMKTLSQQLVATQAQISEGEGWQATMIHFADQPEQIKSLNSASSSSSTTTATASSSSAPSPSKEEGEKRSEPSVLSDVAEEHNNGCTHDAA